jgi:hypothetical protein
VLVASTQPDAYTARSSINCSSAGTTVGFYGGYGPSASPREKGVLHNMTGPAYGEDEEVFGVTWRADMGSAPDRALDVLIRSLDGWSKSAGLSAVTLTIR